MFRTAMIASSACQVNDRAAATICDSQAAVYETQAQILLFAPPEQVFAVPSDSQDSRLPDCMRTTREPSEILTKPKQLDASRIAPVPPGCPAKLDEGKGHNCQLFVRP